MRAQADHVMALLPELQLADSTRIDAELEPEAASRSNSTTPPSRARAQLVSAGAAAVASLPDAQRARLKMLIGRRRSDF